MSMPSNQFKGVIAWYGQPVYYQPWLHQISRLGDNLFEQSLSFRRPVHIDDTLTATLTGEK